MKELSETFTKEVSKVKEGLDTNLSHPMQNISNDIEEATGPIKRQL
jgi:hypothetical protein